MKRHVEVIKFKYWIQQDIWITRLNLWILNGIHYVGALQLNDFEIKSV